MFSFSQLGLKLTSISIKWSDTFYWNIPYLYELFGLHVVRWDEYLKYTP